MERTENIIPIFWAGTALMLFLALALVFLVLFYQNNLARIKRAEAEQLLKVSIESEQQERKRIAADLHDGVCGDLSAIKYYLALFEKQPADPAQMLKEIRDGIDNALINARMVSYKLMPPLLESLGLAAALGDNFTRLSQRTGLSFCAQGDEPKLPLSIKYELFRVVQEFTTNMIKYGNISQCLVAITSDDIGSEISIVDDGNAFDFVELSRSSQGSGLRNISSRIKAIGATITQHFTESGNHFTIKIAS